jgi:hypothetical protein
MEVFTVPAIPETEGISMERAFDLAHRAEACITLAEPTTELFLANLPQEAPDYHSYDDLTELIWRNWLSNPDIKPYAKEKPNIARGKSMSIWEEFIKYGDPELSKKLHLDYFATIHKVNGIKSTMRRTVISDPLIFDFYGRRGVDWMKDTTLTR